MRNFGHKGKRILLSHHILAFSPGLHAGLEIERAKQRLCNNFSANPIRSHYLPTFNIQVNTFRLAFKNKAIIPKMTRKML